jgi:HEAT repeat protein
VLAVTGPPEGHPALLDALEDEASPGRAAAAVALARSGRAGPKLLEVVESFLRARDDEQAVQLGLDMAAALGPQAAPLLPTLKRLGERAQAIVDVLEPDRSTELPR